MKNYLIIISTAAIFIFSGSSHSIFGNNFIPTKRPDKTFKVSSKSKTIEMVKGQTYRMRMKLRTNRYYFMSVKGKKSLGNIQYRIIDPSQNNKVIFDNSAYEFDNNMTFHNEFNREVIVEIRTMAAYFGKNSAKKSNVKILFANKRLKKDEEFDFNDNYNLYAVN